MQTMTIIHGKVKKRKKSVKLHKDALQEIHVMFILHQKATEKCIMYGYCTKKSERQRLTRM